MKGNKSSEPPPRLVERQVCPKTDRLAGVFEPQILQYQNQCEMFALQCISMIQFMCSLEGIAWVPA